MKKEKKVVIVKGIRTPFVKAGAEFMKYKALDLGVHTVNGLVEKSGIDPNLVEELAFGIVVVDPTIPQMAREINFSSILPDQVNAITLTNNCITGLSAIQRITDSIRNGRIEIGIAGGVESMSNFNVLFNPKASDVFRNIFAAKTTGARLKQFSRLRPKDFFPWDYGIAEPSTGLSMGEHCELMVKEWGIPRAEQDEIAFRSHQRAAAATKDGRLKNEIYPLNGVDHDTIVRGTTSIEKLSSLRPVFDRSEKGTLTAGNSSPLTDGAAAILIMSEDKANKLGMEPLAYINDFEFAGVNPKDGLLMGPGIAVPRLLKRTKLGLSDMDIVEVHEAFGGQVACNLKAWKNGWKEEAVGSVDPAKLNPLGSSISIGHPFAATGIRMASTLANEMNRSGAKHGLISICAAGAAAGAMILSRE